MQRRIFSREYKLEAVKLVSRSQSFPGKGQVKPICFECIAPSVDFWNAS